MVTWRRKFYNIFAITQKLGLTINGRFFFQLTILSIIKIKILSSRYYASNLVMGQYIFPVQYFVALLLPHVDESIL